MASGQDGMEGTAVQAAEAHSSRAPTEGVFRAELREILARLRRLSPDDGPGRDAFDAPRARAYDVIDVRATRRRLPEPWPRSVKLAVFAMLLAAVVYGPSYYH